VFCKSALAGEVWDVLGFSAAVRLICICFWLLAALKEFRAEFGSFMSGCIWINFWRLICGIILAFGAASFWVLDCVLCIGYCGMLTSVE